MHLPSQWSSARGFTLGAASRALTLSIVLALVWSVAAIAQEGKPSIALLPAVVHSSENPEYLRQGLSDMLSSRFTQADDFVVIGIEDPRKATTRLDKALEVGREAGADFVLFGSFTRFGAGASLDMQAARTAEGVEGETLREIFVHSGSMGEVIPDLVDLVGKVTRFAIADYVPTSPDTPVTGGGRAASQASVEELQKRIAALEAALTALQEGAPASP